MKLLTFLGTTSYWKTFYVWQDKRYETEFVAEALANWLQPDDIFVFLTERAEQVNWSHLQQRLQRWKVHPVRIPDGRNEGEVWQIFDKVVEQVDRGSDIAIDITHAFRSLPMLLIGVGAFLQAAREVRIQHIFYAPSDREQPAESLVMDLVLLLHLLDWMQATRRLRETGDARWIGETLIQTHDTLRITGAGEPRSLKKAGKELKNLAQALQLGRPIETATIASRLQSILPQAAQEIAIWARPFSLLLAEVTEQASHLAYERPESLSEENLQRQLRFIDQLLKYDMVMQAAQAAREWVVNWAIWYRAGCSTLGKERWLEKESRDGMERDLNSAFPPNRSGSCQLGWLHNPKLNELLAGLWPELCNLRNDLAHCGMREQPLSAQDLHARTRNYLEMLHAIMNLSVTQ